MTDWLLHPYHVLGTLAAIGAIWGLVLMIRAERAEDVTPVEERREAWAKHAHRFPPMTEKAAKGFARDPTVLRDQVSRAERMRNHSQ
jgi:hypothetical protein